MIVVMILIFFWNGGSLLGRKNSDFESQNRVRNRVRLTQFGKINFWVLWALCILPIWYHSLLSCCNVSSDDLDFFGTMGYFRVEKIVILRLKIIIFSTQKWSTVPKKNPKHHYYHLQQLGRLWNHIGWIHMAQSTQKLIFPNRVSLTWFWDSKSRFFRNLGSWSTLRCNKSIVLTSMVPSHTLGCCGVSAIGLQLQNTEFRDFLFKMINFVTLGIPKMANTP